MKRALTLCACLLLLACLLPPTARANAGPPIMIYRGDEQAFVPNQNQEIAVRSEKLSYDIRVDMQQGQADVRAQYEMQNTTSAPVSLLVAFVSTNTARQPTAAFRGESLEVMETRVLQGWVVGDPTSNYGSHDYENQFQYLYQDISFEAVLRAMSGAESVENDRGTIAVTLFTLSFEAGETCELVVEYPEKSSMMRKSSGYFTNSVQHQFYYFLEPARYWKAFSDLTISVKVKGGKPEFNLEGFQRKDGVYTAHFDELPAENLRILVGEGGIEPGTWVAIILGGVAVIVLVGVIVRKFG